MSKKRKIILVSDDFRLPTGVATMCNLILTHSKDFEWVQIGGSRFHPEANKVFMFEDKGIKLYTVGSDPNDPRTHNSPFYDVRRFKEIVEIEKPDGILFFTDPRYFEAYFKAEYDIRKTTPIMFYTIWDNFPLPFYNFGYYNSCDGLFCISKQTKTIVEGVLGDYKKNKVITHVPHGIETDLFKKIEVSNSDFKKILPKKNKNDFNFTFLWSNKNMSRKRPSDVVIAFDMLMTKYPQLKDTTHLIMNTNPLDTTGVGTDLLTIIEEYTQRGLHISFVNNGSLKREELPILYNMADVVICNSDAEGHGLSVTEAIMCEKPVIATVTGGLQDQLGFETQVSTSRHNHKQLERYQNYPNIDENEKHGEWAFPLYPDSSNLIGSVITPYIYEDRVSIYNLMNQMEKALMCDNLPERGKKGREWMIKNGFFYGNMIKKMTESINKTIDNFKPRHNNESILL